MSLRLSKNGAVEKLEPSEKPTLLFSEEEIEARHKLLQKPMRSINNFIENHEGPTDSARALSGLYGSGHPAWVICSLLLPKYTYASLNDLKSSLIRESD